MDLNVQFLGDASKNCIVWVRGAVLPEDQMKLFPFMTIDNLATAANGHRPKTLLLASALWTLQEKMGFYLWMHDSYEPANMLLVMESRNFIRFDRAIALDKWKGTLYLQPFKIDEPKRFMFQLDFDKAFQR